MNKLLFLLLALIPFTLQKFCFDCWSCPTYYYLACKEIKSGDGTTLIGYECNCFLPDFPDLMKDYTPYKMCTGRNQWAWCYLDKITWVFDCKCEYQ